MAEILTISELVDHLIDRYDIQDPQSYSSSEYREDHNGALRKMVERIMKDIMVVGRNNLWDACNPGKGVRCIAIDEFDSLCLEQFAEKMAKREKNVPFFSYNKRRLDQDLERLSLQKDEKKWSDKAAEYIARQNEALENGYYDEVDMSEVVPEVRKKGEEIMLDAIFHAFYEYLDWDLLKKDMYTVQNIPDGFNPGVTPEEAKALTRLDDFRSYVKERNWIKNRGR